MLDGYRMYASTILVVSSMSVSAEIFENLRNSSRIRKMARYTCPVTLRMPDGKGGF